MKKTDRAAAQETLTSGSLPGEVLTKFNCRCFFCGRLDSEEEELSGIFLIPLILGGEVDIDNIIPACEECLHGRAVCLMNQTYDEALQMIESEIDMIVNRRL